MMKKKSNTWRGLGVPGQALGPRCPLHITNKRQQKKASSNYNSSSHLRAAKF